MSAGDRWFAMVGLLCVGLLFLLELGSRRPRFGVMVVCFLVFVMGLRLLVGSRGMHHLLF